MLARLKNFSYRGLMKKSASLAHDKDEATKIMRRYLTHFDMFDSRILAQQVKELTGGKEV